ncbi:inosine-uridine preferring nucleoside hydrolase-like [Vanessa cardui]|uniref:inosine-uridine preferring nucleoside hydrolase-like n=1 Tax=Vanessa cardui TaxID=171605 RepID=UPI001F135653|nr:inosine-uridine preferring nucleoside hydrolase-like [Vanessa cardui]
MLIPTHKLAFAILIPVMVAFVYFLVFFVVSSSYSTDVPTRVKQKLVIDHDGGADDAMAIFMGLLYEKYYDGPEVVALTTTHGNVDEEQVFNNTQRILTVANRRDVAIYRGSTRALIGEFPSDYFFGYDGLGDNNTDIYEPIAAQKEHAVFGLIELSKKYSGELVIVALGSLTNIALAIRIDPNFMSRLSHLYVAAGHVYGEDFTEPEFNANMDIESYYIVASSGTPEKLTIIPFSQIRLHQKISKEWRTDILGSINTSIMQAQNKYEVVSLSVSTYWCLLDPSAMAIALDETLNVQETRYSNNSITLCGDQRGVNTNDFTESMNDSNARVIYNVSKENYKKMLYDIFSAELRTNK